MTTENLSELIFTETEAGLEPTANWYEALDSARRLDVRDAGAFLGTLLVEKLGFADFGKIGKGNIVESFTKDAEPPLTTKEKEQFKAGMHFATAIWVKAKGTNNV